MKKPIVSILSTIILITGLTACGTNETSGDEPKEEVNGSGSNSEDKGTNGIVAGELSPNLEKIILDGKLKYLFSIKNDKETEDVLRYSSSQTYDYSLIDSNGEIVYTYSIDKLFSQMTSEQTLKPGEIVTFEMDLSEVLQNLKPGTYKIEAWSTADERKELKVKAEFNWGGASEGVEEDTRLDATVTYVGLMDSNSIEVINAEGEHDHFRLSEDVKEKFANLEVNSKIIVYYSIIDDQKIIEDMVVE